MALFAVGRSSYGELAGVEQFVTSKAVADQVNSLIAESQGVFSDGAVLSVNEGNRSRPRQRSKRAAYEAFKAGRGPWAPLAAVLYTSTHDESRGNGLDFGVTTRDGRNRALTVGEHAWLVARGRLRGVIWTGVDFGESWHFNGYDNRAVLAPSSTGRVVITENIKILEAIVANADSYTTYTNADEPGRHFVAGAGSYMAIGSALTAETGLDGADVIRALEADGVKGKSFPVGTYNALNVIYANVAGKRAA